MCAKLVAYENVPLGFEMVIDKNTVKIWNLWWNIKLTDDPEAWDGEIKSINNIQNSLNEPAEDLRLIRAQIAEFCRLNPFFPLCIDILCKEIGDGRFSKPLRMGCEGRGLLNFLGYNNPQNVSDQIKKILTEYKMSLDKWLVDGLAENPTESKVFGFLGQSTESKKVFVKKLVSVIDPEEPSISIIKKLSEDKCRETQGNFETLGFRPFNCFKCESALAPTPKCLCCYSMVLDAGLLCAGWHREERLMVDEVRGFVEENILVYSVAINSWLRETPPKPITSFITPIYIFKDTASKIAHDVHSSLGNKDKAKTWLTSCLLKTIKDNQRWQKRRELIDDFPEASSWFKEIL